MALEIAEREREGVIILALKGRITMSEVSPVRDKVAALLADGHNQIVLDLGDVDYIDSTGLGNLVISFTQAKKAGGALVAVETNPIDAVWSDQPAAPIAKVVPHGLPLAGESAEAKRMRRTGHSVFSPHNRFITGWGICLLYLGVFITIAGPTGGLVFLVSGAYTRLSHNAVIW